MNAASSSATVSSTDASAPPVTVASTVPLANASELAQSQVAAGETTASTEHPKGDEGLPQLNTEHWPGQIVWLVIVFAVFYALIAGIFAPRLRKVIDKRGSTIAEDLANARAIRDEAEAQAREAEAETAAAHAAAKKLGQDAIARSNAEIAAAQAVEDAKLNVRLGEAEARIKAARDEAMSHVRDIASDTASALVAKLTGKAPTQAALKSAFNKV
jgi:F-type H+-transporting ATPase subunit b